MLRTFPPYFFRKLSCRIFNNMAVMHDVFKAPGLMVISYEALNVG